MLSIHIILPLLNERSTVASRSGVAGTPVELVVTPDSVTPVTAGGEDVYVSILTPTGPFTDEVRVTFCDYVLFFNGGRSAERWTGEHPGTTVLPLDEAPAIGRRIAYRLRKDSSSQTPRRVRGGQPMATKQMKIEGKLVDQLRAEKYIDLASEYGFTVCPGRAEFIDLESITCEGRRIPMS